MFRDVFVRREFHRGHGGQDPHGPGPRVRFLHHHDPGETFEVPVPPPPGAHPGHFGGRGEGMMMLRRRLGQVRADRAAAPDDPVLPTIDRLLDDAAAAIERLGDIPAEPPDVNPGPHIQPFPRGLAQAIAALDAADALLDALVVDGSPSLRDRASRRLHRAHRAIAELVDAGAETEHLASAARDQYARGYALYQGGEFRRAARVARAAMALARLSRRHAAQTWSPSPAPPPPAFG